MRKNPDARKQEIRAAALDLFRERGYDVVRVEDVLEKVGISKGGFYHHFKSKEDVLRDIVRDEVSAMLDTSQGKSSSSDPLIQLVTLFEKGSADLGADVGLLGTLTSFHARSAFLDELEKQQDVHLKPFIETIIRDGSKADLFRDVDAAATAEIFVASNNHGNRKAILGQLSDAELVAFNATAIDMLGVYLGVEASLAPLVEKLKVRRGK